MVVEGFIAVGHPLGLSHGAIGLAVGVVEVVEGVIAHPLGLLHEVIGLVVIELVVAVVCPQPLVSVHDFDVV